MVDAADARAGGDGLRPGIDVTIRGVPLAEAGDWAARAEALGVDGVVATETNNDPFLPLALAAGTTSRVQLGTGIAVAFPRSVMQTAYTSWDLQALTGGRFVLGLGTQVSAHVRRRYGTTWSQPAARMREYALALRAIWDAWETGERLDFRGEFSTHTLMPPAFRPRPQPHGAPPIWLAAVRERMLEVAGEVADGVLVHPLQTEQYVRQVIRPALDRGAEKAGRPAGSCAIAVAQLVAPDEQQREAGRRRVAFYASTPGYRGVLDLHGWGALGERLHGMSLDGAWDRMAAEVPDEMLDAIVLSGEPTAIAAAARVRTDGLVARINVSAPEREDLDAVADVVAALVAG
ncbi:MAG: TIGR03617 family F420-dependent LLM class oxidoreductase [Patulibacter sp.]